jgi:multidrug efflux pump
VRQNGVTVESAASGFLMMVSLTSTDGRYDEDPLSDYLARNRGRAAPRRGRRARAAVRCRAGHAHLGRSLQAQCLRLVRDDISTAISQQNAQIAPGRLGDTPAVRASRSPFP